MKQLFNLFAVALFVCAFTSCHKDKVEPEQPTITVRSPRYLTAVDGKVYVTCYSPASVVRIDTVTRQVEAICRLGNYQPEGIAVAGGKLFVASSWIQSENSEVLYDNKVYVVDLASFSVERTIEVGLNPDRLRAIDDGHVIVCCNGDYIDVPGDSYIIDATTFTATATGIDITGLDVAGGMVYGYSAPYTSATVSYFKLNPSTLATTDIIDGCTVVRPYGINVIDGDIYLTSSSSSAKGDVYRFGMDGEQKWQCEAGMYTSKVAAIGDGTAYVLNQGIWGGNDASLGRVNLATGNIDNNAFVNANARDLGDIAQDILVYGSKAYVAVTFSNTIEVVGTRDNTSVQIAL